MRFVGNADISNSVIAEQIVNNIDEMLLIVENVHNDMTLKEI